ncbi:class I SAM-dependent methyltransferase [Undibacterium arcticum]|uniref:Class I SAM-dependent methyltransferase n=1 Tax=Undibacterium arcticum TaxID=1762892 RepID=A0ABV7FBT8_9BURK
MQLPEPTSDALAASHALQQRIVDEIRHPDHDGWISFAHYMELALYAPGLGYYSGGAKKLGKDGDFTTAPEITPLFGAALARIGAELMAQSSPQMLEFGAGSGRLAFDILTELAAQNVPLEQYAIVELSGELRARQQELLRGFPQVVWLDRLPAAFSGVVLGNEVLDAMPVQLVVKRADGWREVGVALAPGPDGERFVFRDSRDQADGSAQPELQAQIRAQIPDPDALPDGYLTELHAVGCGFMRTLAQMLTAGSGKPGGSGKGGVALLFDYGFPAHEYYLAQRAQGTLMCHYRHHAHADPFYLPGLQDITAHVDFSAMAQAALDGGLELLGYSGQAAFLIAAGIGELLLRTSPDDAQRYLPQANAVQKLLSPAEMGELFKVLVVGRDVSLPEQFGRGDRSHRLQPVALYI